MNQPRREIKRETLSAKKFSFVLLFQFFACLFLIFAAEAVAGILGFLYRDRVGFFVCVLTNPNDSFNQFKDFPNFLDLPARQSIVIVKGK